MVKVLMLAVVMLAIGGGGAFFYVQNMAAPAAEGEAAEAAPEKKAKPVYWAFEPAFVVNLPDGAYMRYLKVDVNLMMRDPTLAEALDLHTPVLRNRLLMLFSSADYQSLMARSGKEALQAAALAEVNAQLEDVGVAPVEALYFTNFVLQ